MSSPTGAPRPGSGRDAPPSADHLPTRSGRLAGMVGELVGRDVELARVREARASGMAAALLLADPGMGRSSVLGGAADELRRRRVEVVLLRSSASARALRFSGLGPLLPTEVTGPLTFDIVTAAVERRLEASELVLAIDDLHLLDESSVRVIADLLGTAGLFVIATIDRGFLGVDPLTTSLVAIGQEPLDGAVATLDGHTVSVVEIGPLDVEAVGAIAERRVGGRVDAERWWHRSGGNPTVLEQLLDRADARPTSHPHDPPAATDRTVGSLDDDHLSPERRSWSPAARRLLAAIAVAEPLPYTAAISVGGSEAFDELADTGVLTVVDDDAPDRVVRMRHPAHATQVRRSLGALEARGAKRAALLAMRDGWARLSPTGRLRLAALAVDAGVHLDDDELVEVARLAPVAGDPKLALRLAREASDRLGRFEDHRLLADVAHEQGEIIDLESAILQMRSTARGEDDRGAIAVAASQHLLWRVGDADAAQAAFDAVDLGRLPEVAAVHARLLATIGRLDQGIAAAAPLLHHPSPRVRTQAALGTAHALRLCGRPAAGTAVLDEALEASRDVVDPVLSVSAQVISVGRVLTLIESGRWNDAADAALRVVSYAQRYDEAPGRAIAVMVHALVALDAGCPALAIPTLGTALGLFEQLRQPAGTHWVLSARALAHGMHGDAVAARNDLDRLDRMPRHPADLLPALEPRARAWALVAAADPEQARTLLTEATRSLTDRGLHSAAWQCAHDLVSLDRPAVILELAPERTDLDPLDDPMSELRLRHARALQANDATELAALRDTIADVGGNRWAAECAAAVCRSVARGGSKEANRRAGERLRELAERCVGLQIPSLSAGATSKLSPREREIAQLAARGLTSRAIGDRLGLSMRTVDNHLAKCFDKLGARSRAELAELLDD